MDHAEEMQPQHDHGQSTDLSHHTQIRSRRLRSGRPAVTPKIRVKTTVKPRTKKAACITVVRRCGVSCWQRAAAQVAQISRHERQNTR